MALQTMYQAKSNSPQTTLTAIIAADATTLTVFDGSVLPPRPAFFPSVADIPPPIRRKS